MTLSTALDRFGLWIFQRYLFPPSRRPWTWPASGDRRDEWDSVLVPKPDGTALAGLFGRAEGRARGVVVCTHPYKRVGKGFFVEHGHARPLRAAGYHVLLVDFGGFGESRQTSVLFPRDVLAAGEEAARRCPGLPVGYLGVCFGGVYGACAFSTPGHVYRAAILDSPYESALHALAAMQKDVSRPRRFEFQKALVRVFHPLFPMLDPLRHARRAKGLRGVLMIAGGADDQSPVEGVMAYAEAFRQGGTSCQSWVAPDAEHLDAYATHPEEYGARVVAFLDEHLVGTPSRRSQPGRWALDRRRARPSRAA
ncbi:alpha/beta hydrolase [Rubrivirga sp.]|uniref:alpha/beta hydrolase n=1 Tax=Rubrivirga sp. TaxID=1885344 RepID=UPI003B516F39